MDPDHLARADELLALLATHPRVRTGGILDYAVTRPAACAPFGGSDEHAHG
jgi:hypothetical protein